MILAAFLIWRSPNRIFKAGVVVDDAVGHQGDHPARRFGFRVFQNQKTLRMTDK
jgi:hypothetical protein